MERLHAGGRKFVVLDFGRPVLLTDVYIPPFVDWLTVSIDVWNRSDQRGQSGTHHHLNLSLTFSWTCGIYRLENDTLRLTTSCDISRRPLVLHDLQPPVLCRYLRLTYTARPGLGASNCRTSVGSFHGYSHVLPGDFLPSSNSSSNNMSYPDGSGGVVAVLSEQEIEDNISTLQVLADHIKCHYHLACDRLRALLQPLLAHWHKDSTSLSSSSQQQQQQQQQQPSSSHHVDHYLQSQINSATGSTAGQPVSEEDARITDAYEVFFIGIFCIYSYIRLFHFFI